MRDTTPEEIKKEEQVKRQAAFVAEVDALQAKYNIKIGVELTYSRTEIAPHLILIDTLGKETTDVKEKGEAA